MEFEDARKLVQVLDGHVVTGVRCEGMVRISFDGTSIFDLDCESEIYLRKGESLDLIQGTSCEKGSEKLSQLLGRKVLEARILDSGVLRIDFDDEISLDISHQEEYESWQLQGEDGFLFVSTPSMKKT